jgi:hypothetical protein
VHLLISSLLFIDVMFFYYSFFCLHPDGCYNSSRTTDQSSSDDLSELSNDDLVVPAESYVTWNPDENAVNEKDDHMSLGLDDFFLFDLMLLSVLPSLSSMATQIIVLIGHILVVQIGQEATFLLGRLFKQQNQPAVPLPVITVSLYAILLNIFLNN